MRARACQMKSTPAQAPPGRAAPPTRETQQHTHTHTHAPTQSAQRAPAKRVACPVVFLGCAHCCVGRAQLPEMGLVQGGNGSVRFGCLHGSVIMRQFGSVNDWSTGFARFVIKTHAGRISTWGFPLLFARGDLHVHLSLCCWRGSQVLSATDSADPLRTASVQNVAFIWSLAGAGPSQTSLHIRGTNLHAERCRHKVASERAPHKGLHGGSLHVEPCGALHAPSQRGPPHKAPLREGPTLSHVGAFTSKPCRGLHTRPSERLHAHAE